MKRSKNMSDLIQQKTNFVPEDHEQLTALAKSENKTVAQFIRELVGAKLLETPRKRLDPKPEKVEFVLDKKWVKQIVGIARNFNQQTEAMHRKKSLVSLSALKECEDSFNEMNETIQEFMKSSK